MRKGELIEFFQPGRVLKATYTLQQELGRGTFGKTFLAIYEPEKKFVAVKGLSFSNPLPEQKHYDDFQKEGRRMGHLRHTHVVAVYDHDVEEVRDGKDRTLHALYPYLVMAYANEGTTKDRLRRYGILPTDLAVAFLSQAAEGLQYIHEHNIVHRDIKPENLLLNTENGKTTLWVTDLGISTRLKHFNPDEPLSIPPGLGTPPYMSPEQFQDTRSVTADIYSLGITMYQFLTGEIPFKGPNYYDFLIQHAREKPLSIKEVRRRHGRETDKIVEALEKVIGRAIEKAPTDRQQSMAELKEDIQSAYANALQKQQTNLRYFDQDVQTGQPIVLPSSPSQRAAPDAPTPFLQENHASLPRLSDNPERRGIHQAVPSIQDVMNQANEFIKNGEYEEAIKWYDHAISINPEDSMAYNNRGLALDRMGKHKEALQAFDQAITITPDLIDAYLNKGTALSYLGKHKEAITAYDQAITIDPKSIQAYYHKRNALVFLGRYEEANRVYLKYRKLKNEQK